MIKFLELFWKMVPCPNGTDQALKYPGHVAEKTYSKHHYNNLVPVLERRVAADISVTDGRERHDNPVNGCELDADPVHLLDSALIIFRDPAPLLSVIQVLSNVAPYAGEEVRNHTQLKD